MGAESEPPGDVRSLRVPGASAAGSRSAALAGDVDRSVLITGDYNVVRQYFVQHYPSLKDYIYDFDAEKKLAERFVGRVELFRRLDDFAKRPCGYFRVVADAGLGKTALAAAAANRLKAPAFFANASRGLTRPDQCLNHLAVEVIARFGLDHDHLPARAGEDSAFLGKVLAEAAAKAERPLWIVVDALDEADPPGPGRNPLLLPDRLPPGVFILLTHRPGQVALVTAAGTAVDEYRIASSDPAQQADIEAYLRQEADRPEIRRAREAANPPIMIDRFVTFLKGKSEGNFKYLDYVLADIAAGEPGFDPLDLEALPSGLRGYYQQFWSQMEQVRSQEGWPEWNGLYRPTIAFLAAAREAVPASWLGAMLGRPAEEIEERALERWRRFLGQERTGGAERWRVVHQSFADFLIERKVVLPATHDRVAAFYLSAWGGLDAGLPALFDPARGEELDGYGLWHLAEHLERAGRIDDLHRLLRLERRDGGETGPARTQNAWYAARERVGQTEGYMNDLSRAARLVQLVDRPDVWPSRDTTRIGPAIRYALMSTSLNNLARNIPPDLIVALVEKRVWLASQGLAYARALSPEGKVHALIGISSRLDDHEKRMVLQEALDAARGIGQEPHRSGALAALAPRLAEAGRLEQALQVAREIRDAVTRAATLAELGQVEDALDVARGIAFEWARADALVGLAPYLAEAGRLEQAVDVARRIRLDWTRARTLAALGQVEEALDVARGIGDEWSRAGALRELAPYLAEAGRLEQALQVARGVRDDGDRANALAELGEVEEALDVARGISHEGARARTLASLAPYLAEAGRVEALDVARGIVDEEARANALAELGEVEEALDVARGIGDEWSRARTLVKLVPRLTEAGRVERALELARGIGDEWARAGALAELAPRLAQAGRLEQALELVRRIDHDWVRARALVELGWLEEALQAARGIGDEEARARALVDLVPRLAQAGRPERALDAARAIGDDGPRARALAELGEVDEALDVARGIGDALSRARALAGLVPRLAQAGRLEQALDVARGIGEAAFRASALAELAFCLAEAGRPEQAADVARGIDDEWARARALAELGRMEEALQVAREIGHDGSRAGALAELAPRLAQAGRPEQALQVARGIGNARFRAGALADLGQVEEALQAAQGIGDEWDRTYVLAGLVPRLAQAGRLERAVEVARGIDDDWARARALVELGWLEEALQVARGIGDAEARDSALAELAPRLAQAGRREQALDAARAIGHEGSRAVALAALGEVEEALELAWGIGDEGARARALAELAPRLAALPHAEAFPLWAETLQLSATRSRREFLGDLAALASVIAALGGPDAIEETCRAIEDVGRWWP
jgi:tetratricopeptide (TPR) repeat protein